MKEVFTLSILIYRSQYYSTILIENNNGNIDFTEEEIKLKIEEIKNKHKEKNIYYKIDKYTKIE